MEAGLPQLRELFSEKGIQLGDLSVGARAFSNGSGSQSGGQGGQSGQAASGGAATANSVGILEGSAPAGVMRSLQLVDTFA